jgi:hypothetical protein
VPAVATLEEFEQAVREADASAFDLDIEPEASAAARRSLEESGLLLLGEVHGVAENPRLARALLEVFSIGALGLEWGHELAPAVDAALTGRPLPDHPCLWFGDGRVTAGHVAVLRDARPEVVLVDGVWQGDWTWSDRDAAMAERLLAELPAGRTCLVVAGNLHTRTRRVRQGIPMGQHLARRRPGVLEVRIAYRGGASYNLTPKSFRDQPRRGGGEGIGRARLRVRRGHLELELPDATEAVVPQRPFTDVLTTDARIRP